MLATDRIQDPISVYDCQGMHRSDTKTGISTKIYKVVIVDAKLLHAYNKT